MTVIPKLNAVQQNQPIFDQIWTFQKRVELATLNKRLLYFFLILFFLSFSWIQNYSYNALSRLYAFLKKEDFVFPIFSHREAIIEFLITRYHLTVFYLQLLFLSGNHVHVCICRFICKKCNGINYRSAYINVYPSIWACKLININVMCLSVAKMFQYLAILLSIKQLV